jgi:hypothetical protein
MQLARLALRSVLLFIVPVREEHNFASLPVGRGSVVAILLRSLRRNWMTFSELVTEGSGLSMARALLS